MIAVACRSARSRVHARRLGRAVLGSLRDAVRRVRMRTGPQSSLPVARSAFSSMSQGGAWVVQKQDGSKRLPATAIDDAAWSPHGLYLAAARGNELVRSSRMDACTGQLGTQASSQAPAAGRYRAACRIAYGAGPHAACRERRRDGRIASLDARALDRDRAALAWRPAAHELAYVQLGREPTRPAGRRSTPRGWRSAARAAGLEQLAVVGMTVSACIAGGRPALGILDATRTRTVVSAFRSGAFSPAVLRSGSEVHSRSSQTAPIRSYTCTIYSGPRYERAAGTFFSRRRALCQTSHGHPTDGGCSLDWAAAADQWLFIRSAPVKAHRRPRYRHIPADFGPEALRDAREAGAVRNRVLPSVRSRR